MNSTALEAILDVAIGMVFVWLILSVATMSIQEWIASYLKWRANDQYACLAFSTWNWPSNSMPLLTW